MASQKAAAQGGGVRIYTRRGDRGETGLFGGRRVRKSHRRVEGLGSLDELNAWLGLARAFNKEPRLEKSLSSVQQQLHRLSAVVGGASGRRGLGITKKDTAWLEKECDFFSEKLPPLRKFVLPGGGKGGACLHVARAVCRRAERSLCRLAEKEPVSREMLSYLNRLSDLLFLLARYANLLEKIREEHPKYG